MEEIEKTATNFKAHLERLGYSKTSIYMLPRCVADFIRQQNIEYLKKITPQHIQNYHQHLQTRPNKNKPGALSESYISHHIFALKLLFKWLVEIGRLSSNPISGLEFPTPKTKPREILTLEEIKKLYNQCETYKERAILSIYYGCGLRRSEGIKLDVKDVHFRTNLLYVREGKGAKRRVVPMNEQVKKDLQNYLLKERNAKPKESAFLVGQMGNRIIGERVIKILKKLLEKAQIEKEITLHGLRHSIATHLLENGLNVENVRDFLGHSFLESTQIYTRISKQQIHKL
jgi:integrase/recombinase XerD